MENNYDIVVLGSGIAGSIAALILKSIGLSTLVVERKSHPRFVIGESTLPTTSFLLRHLARTYGVPEVAQVAHYIELRENGCAAWPKQDFWYGVHREGTPLDPRHESLFETLLLPIGPDVHMLRADADAFLARSLGKYGIEHLENTEVREFEPGADGVRLRIEGPQGSREVRAGFVVDATGHASFLAKRYGMRDEPARLETNTRSMFGHFKDVRDLDETLGGLSPMFRFRRTAGTMHHCIPGGWCWVIPFDHDVTSVGLQLDQRMYPPNEKLSPEEEMQAIFDRFPSIKAHLGGMKPIRPVLRADRVQFTSSTILSDGFILTPHAAAFIEPLFSTGLVLTLSFIARFAPAARAARDAKDWNIERFRFIERHFFAEIQQIDRIVSGMIQAFRHYDIFKQYWRTWMIGTLAQFNTAILANGCTTEVPMLYGTGVRGFPEALESMREMVCQLDADPVALAAALKERIDPWWERICRPTLGTDGDFSVGSDLPVGVRGVDDPEPLSVWERRMALGLGEGDPAVKIDNVKLFMENAGAMHAEQMARYRRSKEEGTDFHKAYERVFENQNPARFDYKKFIGLDS
jgi:FADH2 O2-dependent halogenase